MPNWIANKLTIKDPEAFKAIVEFLPEMDFEKIIPMPDYIYKGLLGRVEEEIYGRENCWYDWSIKNWGTKWNADNTYIDYENQSIYFQTAWDGVPKLMGLLSQKFNAEFIYKYADEDRFMNTGNFSFNNGKVVNHTYNNWNYGAYRTYEECWEWHWEDSYMCPKVYINRLGESTIVYCPVQRAIPFIPDEIFICPVQRI